MLLSNTSLAHARDVVDARNSTPRWREASVRAAISSPDTLLPNLTRLTDEGIDTYGESQLAFSISLIVQGAATRLAARTRQTAG